MRLMTQTAVLLPDVDAVWDLDQIVHETHGFSLFPCVSCVTLLKTHACSDIFQQHSSLRYVQNVFQMPH